jgi:hypothetical protein
MTLPTPSPAQLTIFVFGPGTGELIAVRSPENQWLIVDGCGPASRPDALQLLAHYEAQPSYVVLTHPHRDHAMGLAQAIEDWCPEGAQDRWPVLGMLLPPAPSHGAPLDDPQGTLQRGVTERAIAAILDRWRRHLPCKWEMAAGDVHHLGAASFTVLAPEAAEVQAARQSKLGFDENRLSTVLSLQWGGHRVVLGSDLVAGWPQVRQRDPSVHDHQLLKIPHHGSRPALHASLLRSTGSPRTWIVTPFASGNLPRFDTDGGIAFMHTFEEEVVLTSLPRARDAQGGLPGASASRADLAAGPSTWTRDPPAPTFPGCFVAVLLTAGQPPTHHYGPGAIRVAR